MSPQSKNTRIQSGVNRQETVQHDKVLSADINHKYTEDDNRPGNKNKRKHSLQQPRSQDRKFN